MEGYGQFTEIYKRVQRYPSKSLPPGTDTETKGAAICSTYAAILANSRRDPNTA